VHPVPRKIIVGIVGGACLVVGMIMLVTPGPAVVFIPLGVLLLATEFPWAEKWFERLRDGLQACPLEIVSPSRPVPLLKS
jgi:hypothetical protein